MKQRVRNIFFLTIASLIFFVGAGVTIVDLCCPKCIPIIFSSNEHDSHCELASDLQTKDNISACCSDVAMVDDDKECTHQHSEDECGTTERISVDINNTISKPNITNPLVWSVMTLHTDLLNCLIEKISSYDTGNKGKVFVPIPPRDYLSLIMILII